MAKIILISGGARSGKSDYALTRAETLPAPRTFLATSPITDGEMAERIRRHQEEREGGDWHSVEEQVDLVAVLESLDPGGVCLVDCLTLWVNNLMYHAEKRHAVFSEDDMVLETKRLLKAAERQVGTLIFVTNEVGMGVVPDNLSARRYRDLVGRCNRKIAAVADEVILVSCGIPLTIKKPE